MRVLSGLFQRLVGPNRRPLTRFLLLGLHIRLKRHYRRLGNFVDIILKIREHHFSGIAVHRALSYGDDLLWFLSVLLFILRCFHLFCRAFNPLEAEKGIGKCVRPLLILLVLAHASHEASRHGVEHQREHHEENEAYDEHTPLADTFLLEDNFP
jgi:hypothetical protein